MTKFILRIIANTVAIFVAVRLVEEITFTGDFIDYLIVGIVLALANTFIRPILKIISAPLIFITMGLFMIVINALILFAVDYFVEALTITGFMGYLWGTIIIAIANAVIVGSFKQHKKIETE
ncbi:MAG TPA: phage holin family protein [Candidatus Portnoybacteria bacterium]|jgi:putative membrane protein|nr:phage holin family protein [Candidatus Portnoybacteria bacterium]MDD5752287.1 phage holin family protein [Candidatus Portnoybacteria bacterium]HNU96889.1 phage holin family protein [Candidatus Portnoybacteria bacterium]HOZ16335.1 phage holin family protein [Candidatus Portnoybacteria bacterium]HPH52234.1 phage holin family protein [Candidatus Portnoybacteria bacterium]